MHESKLPFSEPREGELYRVITVADRSFTIRYGYYSDLDRESDELLPIFPDFILEPLYTNEGRPFCTRVQDACRNYASRSGRDGDNWCGDCKYYPDMKEEIGVCLCDKRKITKP